MEDLIILSIHQGMPARQSTIGLTDVERNLYKDILLAQNVPGVDVIVTGHAHQGTERALVSNGAIIVSTPQDLALIDARKGVSMFKQENINEAKNLLGTI